MRIFIIIFLILITGCSTQTEQSTVRTINNDFMNEPSELILDQIHVLDSTKVSYPISLRFSEEGDIYVLEYKSDKLKVFDKQNFELKDSINSPEKNVISSFSYYDGKLVINCSGKKKINIIDSKDPENSISSISIREKIPNRIELLPNGNFFGTFTSNLSGRDDTFMGFDLMLTDGNFKTIKLLSSFFGSYNQGNIDPEISIFPFAINHNDNSVFVAISSNKFYTIMVYDMNMKLNYVMKNRSHRIGFTESEKKRINKTTSKFRLTPFKNEEKTLIESMTTDSEGNLWVRKAHDADKHGENTAVIDIFDPRGKYIDTYLIENVPRIGNFYINGENMYIVDPFGSRIAAYKIYKDQIKRRK